MVPHRSPRTAMASFRSFSHMLPPPEFCWFGWFCSCTQNQLCKVRWLKKIPKYLLKCYSHPTTASWSALFFNRSTLGLLCDCNSRRSGAGEGTVTCSMLLPSHTTSSVCIQDELYVDEFLTYCRVHFRWSKIKRKEIGAWPCEENWILQV